MGKPKFWALPLGREVTRNERAKSRWCSKCGHWVAKKWKTHRCDVPPREKRYRRCKECGKYVRLSVGNHRCDDNVIIDPTVAEKRCLWCGEDYPLTERFFYRNGTKWRPECKACRKERKAALKRGAKRRAPWHGVRPKK